MTLTLSLTLIYDPNPNLNPNPLSLAKYLTSKYLTHAQIAQTIVENFASGEFRTTPALSHSCSESELRGHNNIMYVLTLSLCYLYNQSQI